MRGILTGPVEDLATEARARINDRIALTMSQSIMYGFKSDRHELQARMASCDRSPQNECLHQKPFWRWRGAFARQTV